MNKSILIEPGHGGWQNGCTWTPSSGPKLLEKDWTLRAALDLKTTLSPHLRVELTRTEDRYIKPADRQLHELRFRPDLVLSIHVNSTPGTLHGMQTYYWPGNTDGARVATGILRRAPVPLAYYRRPFKAFDDPADPNDDWLSRPQEVVGLYRSTTVLVEVGYMSHRHDRTYIHSAAGRAQITDCLAGAVLRWAQEHTNGSK
jgi:N-acetylmuramoyl-L-alanine amidase